MRAHVETKTTSDAMAILDRMAGDSPELRRLTEGARVNAAVAQLVTQDLLFYRVGSRGLAKFAGACLRFVDR